MKSDKAIINVIVTQSPPTNKWHSWCDVRNFKHNLWWHWHIPWERQTSFDHHWSVAFEFILVDSRCFLMLVICFSYAVHPEISEICFETLIFANAMHMLQVPLHLSYFILHFCLDYFFQYLFIFPLFYHIILVNASMCVPFSGIVSL